MGSALLEAIVSGRKTHLPSLYKVISLISLLVGAACAVPAVVFTYLNVNPPEPRSGDIYFGDGTGFVIGGVAACFAAAALTTAILIPVLWRKGHTAAATVFAAFAPPLCAIPIWTASQLFVLPF